MLTLQLPDGGHDFIENFRIYFFLFLSGNPTLNVLFGKKMNVRVVSGLPCALYSFCCLGVSTILESEKL